MRVHRIPLFPTPSSTSPDPEQGSPCLLLLPTPHLTPPPSSSQPLLLSRRVRGKHTHPFPGISPGPEPGSALQLCLSEAATVPSELQAGAMGSCSRSDRHKDDSFPMFIPPLPIQQPSHFFSFLLCIQARERFAVCSARVGFQLCAHSPGAAR